MKNKGVYSQEDGSKVARMGSGFVCMGIGFCNEEKVVSFANTRDRGFPGDYVDNHDEPDIYIAFKDNSAIQRLIDELIKLRDHK